MTETDAYIAGQAYAALYAARTALVEAEHAVLRLGHHADIDALTAVGRQIREIQMSLPRPEAQQ